MQTADWYHVSLAVWVGSVTLVDIYSKLSTAEVGSSWSKMLEAVIFRSMNTHQVLIVVVDTRVLGSVADTLQEGCFASISPTDYKYTKASILRSEIIRITVAHGCWGWEGKEEFRGDAQDDVPTRGELEESTSQSRSR